MVRRISSSQLRSQLQQAASRQREAINRYNAAVRKVNHDRRQAVDKYNQVVRAHNANVRANRARLSQALSRLQALATTSVRYREVRVSSQALHSAFVRLEVRYGEAGVGEREFLGLAEQETANSLEVARVLAGEAPEGVADGFGPLEESTISAELREMSQDLESRWKGALFALHPNNPDASRHFCTSAREMIDQILSTTAPNDAVISANPSCARTQQGLPTRRERVAFLLGRYGLPDDEATEFTAKDVDDVIDLFRIFNDSTHGPAGRLVLGELSYVKRRVEDGVRFLSKIVRRN